MANVTRTLPNQAQKELRVAFAALEHPSFAARLSSVIGMPLESGLRLLGVPLEHVVRRAAETLVTRALHTVIPTLPARSATPARNGLHAGMCVGAGALGGFLGLPGLLAELPVTTGIILRSIADIGRAQGESLDAPDAKLACIEVFAFGGPSTEDDAAETGYYGMRVAMATHFSTFRTLLGQPVAETALPSTVIAIRAVASRFGVAISDKVAAQLVPVLGAAAGAFVNGLFIRHFQNIATGHFTIRRLEREHGHDVVHAAYEKLRPNTEEEMTWRKYH